MHKNKAEGQTSLFLQLNTAKREKTDGGETYRLKQVKVIVNQPQSVVLEFDSQNPRSGEKCAGLRGLNGQERLARR